ncbi:MAG TPA: BNR-4 repeat-containing protein, partial [Planctomycetota bacterium]|nr:BNR-4 repeat-containing protein [Planctomycetota bacterium]
RGQTALCRRSFLSSLGLGGASLVIVRQARAKEPSQVASSILLSKTGSDRATAYVMSNKVARRRGLLVCTWLGSDRQNCWALVEPTDAKLLKQGVVGEPRTDNHCGGALATDTDGTLHLVVGAHHGSFEHYRMPPDQEAWEPVADGRALGQAATYPSVVCDGAGTLHLAYRQERGGRDPRVCYCRRPRDGKWAEPRVLVASAVAEHSWVTNAIEVGPKGRVHLIVSNTLPVPEAGPEARYYGASHLHSDDSGATWRQLGRAEPLKGPAPAAVLARIECDALDPARTEKEYGAAPGPLNSYYHKILLSNPAIDEAGQPWVIVHNLLTRTASLFRWQGAAGWAATPLLDAVRSVLPGFHIQHCGQLSRHRDGTVEAVLMAAPEGERAWGAKGTRLVRVLVGPAGAIRRTELMCPQEESDVPCWLPSLERWCWHAPVERPALLYTRGINAGGYQHNRNSVNTEVWAQPR